MTRQTLALVLTTVFLAAPLASAAQHPCCCEPASQSSVPCHMPCSIQPAVPVATEITPAPMLTSSPTPLVAMVAVRSPDLAPVRLQPARYDPPSLHAPPLRRYLLACIFRL